MLLASHIIISGILGLQTQNYFLAAAIGLFSHYVLDAMPHWDNYLGKNFKAEIENEKNFYKNKKFWLKMGGVAIDILTGLVAFFYFSKFINVNYNSALVAMFFSIVPDGLQFLYFVFDTKILKINYEFQHWLHKTEPGFWPGIIMQVIVILLVFFLAWMR